jgi:hypothetical protein
MVETDGTSTASNRSSTACQKTVRRHPHHSVLAPCRVQAYANTARLDFPLGMLPEVQMHAQPGGQHAQRCMPRPWQGQARKPMDPTGPLHLLPDATTTHGGTGVLSRTLALSKAPPGTSARNLCLTTALQMGQRCREQHWRGCCPSIRASIGFVLHCYAYNHPGGRCCCCLVVMVAVAVVVVLLLPLLHVAAAAAVAAATHTYESLQLVMPQAGSSDAGE